MGYTPEQREEIIQKIVFTLSEGFTINAACAEAGINTDTYYEWKKKPDVAARFEIAWNLGESTLLKNIKEGGKGWQSNCWILERTRAQWRERKYIGVGDVPDDRLLELIRQGDAVERSEEEGHLEEYGDSSVARRVRGLVMADEVQIPNRVSTNT
jgi:hypothetical protein